MAQTDLSGQLDPGMGFAEAAMTMHFFAGLMIPPSLQLAVAAFKNIADTGQMARVGDDWLVAAEKLANAMEKGWGVDQGLGDYDWKGLDRIQFQVMLTRYSASTALTAALCVYVGITLVTSALIVFIMDLLLIVSGTIMITLVALIVVCMVMSAVPFVGPAFAAAEKALRVAATFCANTFKANIELISKLLDKILALAANYMMRMAAVEAAGQVLTVNPEAIADLLGGAADSVGDVLKGSLELLVRNLKALALGKKFPPPEYWPSGDSPQTQEA